MVDMEDIGIGDAAIIGGLLGLAHESGRDQSEDDSSDGESESYIEPEDISDVGFQQLYAEDPELARFLIRKSDEFREKSILLRESKLTAEEEELISKDVQHIIDSGG
jgi:hypothetical protein